MARFYQTSQPEFVQDIIYQPPWQLMQQVLANKQQGYDNAVASTELFKKNMLDIKHLGFEEDRAKEIKDYWNSQIDNVTSQLKANPGDYNKFMPVIRDLGRQLEQDRREGNISKLEGRYNAWQQLQKDNEDLLRGNSKEGIQADPALYRDILGYFYEDIKNRAISDFDAVLSPYKGVGKPDMNSKDIRDALDKFKSSSFEKSNGMYKIDSEYVTESEAEKAFFNLYMSNPNTQSYLKQQVMLKDPMYYDSTTGKARDLFITDSNGNTIINPQHGFASGINAWGDILSFNKQKLDEDKYGLSRQDYQQKSALQYQKGLIDYRNDRANKADELRNLLAGKSADLNKMIKEYELKSDQDKSRFEQDLDKLIIEYGEESLEGSKAMDLKNRMNAKNTFSNISLPTITYEANLMKLQEKDPTAIQNEQLARDRGRKALGLKQNSLEHKFVQYMDAQLAKGNTDKDDIVEKFTKQATLDRNFAPYMYNAANSYYLSTKQKLEDIANKYSKEKSKFFKNTSSTRIDLAPVTSIASSNITSTINSNPSSYITTDDKGNILDSELKKTVKNVESATSANPLASIGVKVKYTDGTTGYVMPKGNSNGKANYETIKNYLLDGGITDKQSSLYRELSNSEYVELATRFSKAIPTDNQGTKKVLFSIPGSKEKIPIHLVNGSYYIIDPNDPNNKSAPMNLTQVWELIQP